MVGESWNYSVPTAFSTIYSYESENIDMAEAFIQIAVIANLNSKLGLEKMQIKTKAFNEDNNWTWMKRMKKHDSGTGCWKSHTVEQKHSQK